MLKFRVWLENLEHGRVKHKDSFTHEGKTYNLIKLRSILRNRKDYNQSLSSLVWLLKDNPPNKADLIRADKTAKHFDIPIFVTRTSDGKLVPVDGYHRLIKAHQLDIKTLPAKHVTKQDLKKCEINSIKEEPQREMVCFVPNFYEWLSNKNSLLSEIKTKSADELKTWHGENELPFNNLFPDGKLRTVIPFVEDLIPLSIVDKLVHLGYQIDFKNGAAVKDKRSIRLGKLILQKKSANKPEVFTAHEKEWWTHQGHPIESLEYAYRHKNYTIIVSRSPYDIVRMSDHDEWRSCHGQGREYFHCAIQEAKGGGPIAYVVNRQDLENIKDLQSPEIFADPQRGILGIKPISRIRLRMFRNKKDDYDLAVPEIRSYGKDIPGFDETLRQWAIEKQQDVLKGKRPKMDDFVRLGGSYTDSSSSDLFNNLFQDDEDHGDVEFDGEGGQSMFDQYEEEIDSIDREYQDQLKFAHAHAEVEESDGEPYVWYNGGFYAQIPIELQYALPADWGTHKERKRIHEGIENLLHYLGIYGIENIEVFEETNGVAVRVDITDEDRTNHPDSYRSFIEYLIRDVEEEKDKIISGIAAVLMELGYAKPHYVSKILGHHEDDEQDVWLPHQFQHFYWTQDNNKEMSHTHAVNVWMFNKENMSRKVIIGNMNGQDVKANWKNSISEDAPGFNQFTSQLLAHINQAASAQIARQNQPRQKLLWGKPGTRQKPFSGQFNIIPSLSFTLEPSTMNVFMEMDFQIHIGQSENDVKDAVAFIDYIDKNFDFFIREAQMLFNKVVKPVYPMKQQTESVFLDWLLSKSNYPG